MIGVWMARMLVATLLIAVAARAAEEAARVLGRPRRWVWAAALALAVALPWLGGLVAMPAVVEGLLDRLLPGGAGASPLPGAVEAAAAVTGADGLRSIEAGSAIDAALLAGWALASLAVSLVFGRTLGRIRAVPGRRRRERADGIDIVRSEAVGPATVGAFRPAIVLPRWVDELPTEESALILAHEREHATARDPLLLAASAVPLVAAPWCLPLWWMHRRLRDAAEADCDGRVLAGGADRLIYGRALLRTAGRPSAVPFAVPALAGRQVTRLERRILAMTESRPNHPSARAVAFIAIAAVSAAAACDSAESPAGPPDDADGAATVSEDFTAVEATGRVESVGGVLREVTPGLNYDPGTDATGSALSEYNFSNFVQEQMEDVRRAQDERAAERRSGTFEAREDRVLRLRDFAPTRVPAGPADEAALLERRTTAEARQREVELRESQVRHRAPGLATIPADVTVYVDGRRVEPASPTMRTLDPAAIERIEVVKRAGGGTIHITTKG